jgi:hypothetical protein
MCYYLNKNTQKIYFANLLYENQTYADRISHIGYLALKFREMELWREDEWEAQVTGSPA